MSQAIELTPGQAHYLEERGRAYYASSNYDQAISDFTKVLELPDTPDSWAIVLDLRGEAYLAKGDGEKAQVDFKHAEFFRNIKRTQRCAI